MYDDVETPAPARLAAPSARVRKLMSRMTLDQKLAQLVGYWVDKGGEVVAPMAGERGNAAEYDLATADGVGHLTRVFGTRPVDPIERARWLWDTQRALRERSGHGIPAIVHEEALTGLAAWTAATFPTPLAWGATFDPDLVEQIGRRIGIDMHALGIHQALAPVLDVIVDPRWGRVDECIGEDPFLVGVTGSAYVRGIQSAGVHATLKHFAGYSASMAGRNHAPARLGPRFLADVILPPFEMAVRSAGARSVMNSYAEIDGVPVAADPAMLTGLLREEWGFDGVVVADYFAIEFLHTMHAVAADLGEAASLALRAGIDVELPTGDAYLAPLRARLAQHPEELELVERSVARVLAQKEALGLLDATFDEPPATIDLDSAAHRALARRSAEQSLVLLTNDGTLPLGTAAERIAIVGPNADSAEALMGCYSFVNHVLAHHPGTDNGIVLPTVLEAIRAELPAATISFARGCGVEAGDDDDAAIADAVATVREADVAVVVLGDRAGLFGRGTVGEGNDAEDLSLPGRQSELAHAALATGTPVVVVLLTGRPYALGELSDAPYPPAAIVQSFFPGEEGAVAIARVLSGAAAPSGRLPVTIPRSAGAQPYSYLHPRLGGTSDVSSAAVDPVFAFGHGLTYTTFTHTDLSITDATTTGGVDATVTVTNTGRRDGTDVVQLYAHDVYASVTRPVAELVGFARITLAAGASARVRFQVPPARLSFTGRDGARIVEPGELDLWCGSSCEDRETAARVGLDGELARVGLDAERLTAVTVLGV